MISLAFASPTLFQLRTELEASALESAAILLCVPVRWGDRWRLLVREVHVAGEADYLERTAISLRLDPEFCLPLEKTARLKRWSLVYVHTHPRAVAHPGFSDTDDRTEIATADYLQRRSPDVPHLSLLFPRDDAALCRVLGKEERVRVVEVGADLAVATDDGIEAIANLYDRQVRAFGYQGQQRIAALKVAIVGLGGTGSFIAQQLAHLGVTRFVLVDPDKVEASNLNRLVGAVRGDAGRVTKVDVAARMIEGLQPDAVVEAITGDITDLDVARRVAGVDFLFSCTDNHASRHTINQLAYQYLVPSIDLGVGIGRQASGNMTVSAHVQMLAPGLPCLWCANHLDASQVRRELMTEAQRGADPYFANAAGVPQPAVISLNGTAASVAVTMFLASVAGVPSKPRYLAYDAVRGRMNALAVAKVETCPFCGTDSALGWGDSYPLPGRQPHD